MDESVVEFVELDGELHAAVVVGAQVSWRPVARLAEVSAEVAALRFAARRLVLRRGGALSLAVARSAAAHAATRLDELLLGPLAATIGDRALVIVATQALHGLPWPMLPSCRGRSLTVSFSGATTAAGQPSKGDSSVLLVAAPSPPRATAEIAAIARARPSATVLAGSDARTALVLAALGRAQIVHVAAHGCSSYLSLVDGRLPIRELARVGRPPRLLILSACDAGLSAAAILGPGTRSLVASVCPVDDAATGELMVDLHRRLCEGAGPAPALAAAQSAFAPFSSAFGFVCFTGR